MDTRDEKHENEDEKNSENIELSQQVIFKILGISGDNMDKDRGLRKRTNYF